MSARKGTSSNSRLPVLSNLNGQPLGPGPSGTQSSRLTTPLLAGQSARPKTPTLLAEAINSMTQQKEISKIKALINDPSIKIKLLSIGTLIQVTNIIFQHMEVEEVLNSKNYKDLLREVLNDYMYPYPLPNSVLISPSSTNAFPKILHLWSFLMDKIIDGSNANVQKMCANFDLKSKAISMSEDLYRAFNNDENEEQIEKMYKEKIYENYGYDAKKHELLKKQFTLKEGQLKEQQQSLDKDDALQKDYAQKVEELEEHLKSKREWKLKKCKQLIDDKVELINTVKYIDVELAKHEKKLLKYKDSPCEVENLKQEIKDHHVAIEESTKRTSVNMALLEELDYKVSQMTHEIKKHIININGAVDYISGKLEIASGLFLSDTRIAAEQFCKELMEKEKAILECRKEITEMLETVNNRLAQEMLILQELDAKAKKTSEAEFQEDSLTNALVIKEQELQMNTSKLQKLNELCEHKSKEIESFKCSIDKLKGSIVYLKKLHSTVLNRLEQTTFYKEQKGNKIIEVLNCVNAGALKHFCDCTTLFKESITEIDRILEEQDIPGLIEAMKNLIKKLEK